MIKLSLLSMTLIIAGTIHLLDPYSFINAIPLFVPFKMEIIYLTGYLEFILAIGFFIQRIRSAIAVSTAIYFALLIPIHIYVSWNNIPMFGISDPLLLWARTLFQLIFIWWAYSLRKV